MWIVRSSMTCVNDNAHFVLMTCDTGLALHCFDEKIITFIVLIRDVQSIPTLGVMPQSQTKARSQSS